MKNFEAKEEAEKAHQQQEALKLPDLTLRYAQLRKADADKHKACIAGELKDLQAGHRRQPKLRPEPVEQ